jgi:hypothetical protein
MKRHVYRDGRVVIVGKPVEEQTPEEVIASSTPIERSVESISHVVDSNV